MGYRGVTVGTRFALVPGMPRLLRFVVPRQMVEVTTRTIQSRLLLRPSPELNAAILAVLGRALHRYDVALHGFAVMSNHVHLAVSPADGQELARFMQFVNGNISSAVGRLHDWQGSMWERRYVEFPACSFPPAGPFVVGAARVGEWLAASSPP